MFGALLPCTLLTAAEVKHLNVDNSDVGKATQNVSRVLICLRSVISIEYCTSLSV